MNGKINKNLKIYVMKTSKLKSKKREKGKITLVILFAISIFLMSNSNLYSQSIAYKLAVVEKNGYVSDNDQTVKRFDYLLSSLDNKYVDSKQEIADKTVKAKQLLADRGVNESMIKMMEGMNTLNDPKDTYKNYNEYLTIYIILRSDLPNHDETISSMKSSLSLIGIDGLLKAAGIK